MIQNKNILMTGQSGFLGANIFHALKGNNRIYSICRFSPKEFYRNTKYIKTDLNKPLDTKKLPKRVDYIIHFAAIINSEEYNCTESDLIRVNLESTLHLLEYAKNIGVERFVFASTGGVYKEQPYPLTEEDTCCYKGLYSLTKYLCEEAAKSYRNFFKYTILRYFFPYGPGQKEARLIPRLVKLIKKGQAVPINKDGSPAINPIYCSDFVEATIKAIEYKDNILINIAGVESKKINEIADMIGWIVKKKPRFVIKNKVVPSNLVADISLMKKEFGFIPKVKMFEGLRCVCEDKY